jgi:hypothetical protein
MPDKIFLGNKPCQLWKKSNVSETISASIIPLMMEAEMVSETLGFCSQLTRLVAQEEFIEFTLSESFKTYKLITCCLVRNYHILGGTLV